MKGLLPLIYAVAAPLVLAQDNQPANSDATTAESTAASTATARASGGNTDTATSDSSATTTAASSATSDADSTSSGTQSSTASVDTAAPSIVISDEAIRSNKRGLCYVNPTVQSDNNIWIQTGSDLSWYYNYGPSPTSIYQDSQMEFVPMLWGAPGNPESDMTFYNTVVNLIEAGQNITAILGFNEPDGCDGGGACVDAGVAATVWKKQVEPLKKKYPNLRIGAPAVTGSPRGVTWLANWQENCASLEGSEPCVMDFMPIHWYGNFAGLASHIGQINGTYSKNVSSLWVTEYALNDQPLLATQEFYNISAQYFDRLDYIERYSYFGAFRSDVSNVGPNSPFLTQNGRLTDIGSWYLGGVATGNIPSSAAGSVASGTVHIGGTYSGKPYSSASRFGASTGWTLCIAAMLALVMAS